MAEEGERCKPMKDGFKGQKFCDLVDGINEKSGRYTCWLAMPMMGVIVYEVLMRYFLRAPTIWAWDTVRLMLLLFAAFGAGYGLVHNVYVRVDIIFARLSPKRQAWVDLLITGSLFLFFYSILLWQIGSEMAKSWEANERMESLWAPRIYPFKTGAFIGVLLMWLQGIANFIRDLIQVMSDKEVPGRRRVSGFLSEEEGK
jgi:TRAP-type mannitol/chloroaromatic compound transport system permease small subunit